MKGSINSNCIFNLDQKEKMSNSPPTSIQMHATTIILVRKQGQTVIAGDGQVSLGQTIMKGNARKVRRLGKGDVIAGFAGTTIGSRLLTRIPEKVFRLSFRILLSLVALGLIREAFL